MTDGCEVRKGEGETSYRTTTGCARFNESLWKCLRRCLHCGGIWDLTHILEQKLYCLQFQSQQEIKNSYPSTGIEPGTVVCEEAIPPQPHSSGRSSILQWAYSYMKWEAVIRFFFLICWDLGISRREIGKEEGLVISVLESGDVLYKEQETSDDDQFPPFISTRHQFSRQRIFCRQSWVSFFGLVLKSLTLRSLRCA